MDPSQQNTYDDTWFYQLMTQVPSCSWPIEQAYQQPPVVHAPAPYTPYSPLLESYPAEPPAPVPVGVPAPNTVQTPSEMLMEMQRERRREGERGERERKERKRGGVGFDLVNLDTLSQWEKKWTYVRSLESYILYLHEQLALIGARPVRMVRMDRCRGLSSRSQRTMVVHLQNIARELNQAVIRDQM